MGRANLIFAQVTRTLKMKVVAVATAVVLILLHGCCALDSEDVLESCIHVHEKRVECGKDDAKDIDYKCHLLANHATKAVIEEDEEDDYATFDDNMVNDDVADTEDRHGFHDHHHNHKHMDMKHCCKVVCKALRSLHGKRLGPLKQCNEDCLKAAKGC